MKFLITGLGNPGAEYELTRHNVGFLVLDQLADKQGASFEIDRLAEKAEFKYKGKTIHLIKPTTFMNLSGKAIAYWLQELKIEKEQQAIRDRLAYQKRQQELASQRQFETAFLGKIETFLTDLQKRKYSVSDATTIRNSIQDEYIQIKKSWVSKSHTSILF